MHYGYYTGTRYQGLSDFDIRAGYEVGIMGKRLPVKRDRGE